MSLTLETPQTKNDLLRIYFSMQEDGLLRSEYDNAACSMDSAIAVWYFHKFRPMYCGYPRPDVMTLLKGARRPIRSLEGKTNILHKMGLMYKLPFVRGKKRTSYLTTDIGLSVLQLFCNKSEEFAEFYDVYVSQKDEARIEEYGIEHRLGLTIQPIADILDLQKRAKS